MARVDVTQATVLERMLAYLRSALNLNDRQCYECLQPDAPPRVPVGGECFVSVSPGEGEFIGGEQICENLTEEWTVTVTAYARIQLDSSDHDEKVLRDAGRGLLILKEKILRTLVGQDLITLDGDTFLRNLLFAQHATRPAHDRDQGIAWISLTFGVHFDWDLT